IFVSMKVTESSIEPADLYRTIEAPSEGLFKDRGSRFISKAFPVQSTDQIKTILDSLRKEYHDARHHCYAYRIGQSGDFRTNDDGEPTNSAGKPIYGQILSNDLSNVLIVVIRYFGGTLLGVGGLINAYRTAAQEAIKNATIIERTYDSKIRISCPYPMVNDVMKIIRDEQAAITDQYYSDPVRITIQIRQGGVDRVISRLNKLKGVFNEAVNL
ncbi:MAG: YigZ family protein, partial [Bacteroidales bacterium]